MVKFWIHHNISISRRNCLREYCWYYNISIFLRKFTWWLRSFGFITIRKFPEEILLDNFQYHYMQYLNSSGEIHLKKFWLHHNISISRKKCPWGSLEVNRLKTTDLVQKKVLDRETGRYSRRCRCPRPTNAVEQPARLRTVRDCACAYSMCETAVFSSHSAPLNNVPSYCGYQVLF